MVVQSQERMSCEWARLFRRLSRALIASSACRPDVDLVTLRMFSLRAIICPLSENWRQSTSSRLWLRRRRASKRAAAFWRRLSETCCFQRNRPRDACRLHPAKRTRVEPDMPAKVTEHLLHRWDSGRGNRHNMPHQAVRHYSGASQEHSLTPRSLHRAGQPFASWRSLVRSSFRIVAASVTAPLQTVANRFFSLAVCRPSGVRKSQPNRSRQLMD